MGEMLLRTVDILFPLLTLIIIARVIISWLPQYRYSQVGRIIFDISDPIMRPIQNMMPSTGMIDFSPMIAIIALWVIQIVLDTIISSIFNL